MVYFKEEYWAAGGFYELNMQFDNCNNNKLRKALLGIWRSPELVSCCDSNHIDPRNQPPVDPNTASVNDNSRLYGLVKLPNGELIACGTFIFTHILKPDIANSEVIFYIPWAALFDVSETLGIDTYSSAWMMPISDLMAKVGKQVYSKVRFTIAAIGTEISSSDVEISEPPKNRGSVGFLWPNDAELNWYPPNWGD